MRKAEIILNLDIKDEVKISPSSSLEVSLDCSYCERTDRTIIFKQGNARCCPGSESKRVPDHPPYPGQITNIQLNQTFKKTTLVYSIEYNATPFKDRKYEYRLWAGYPTWARISFNLICPKCNIQTANSVQNNIVRPFASKCSCGYIFFTERDEMPIIRWLDLETNKWNQVVERFGIKND